MRLRFFFLWLVGILIACAIGIGLWRSPSVETHSPNQNLHDSAQSSESLDSESWDIETLTIDSEHLLQDIEALAFERASEAGRSRARRYLTQQLESVGWKVEVQPFVPTISSPEPQGGDNLVAVRLIDQEFGDPETEDLDKASELIVAAHYDTVADCPGADDNGSGVATLLELARIFSDYPTPRPIKLVLFDHEEQGLWGSQAFVASLKSESAPLMGAIILEMLGYACDVPGCQTYPEVLPIAPPSDVGNFLAVVGNVEHPELIEAFQHPGFQESASEPSFFLLPLQVPALSPGSPDLLRSDHVPFWQGGYGAVMVTDTANFRNPHYHQPSDRPDTLNPEFLSYSATTVARAIARLLNAPHSPS